MQQARKSLQKRCKSSVSLILFAKQKETHRAKQWWDSLANGGDFKNATENKKTLNRCKYKVTFTFSKCKQNLIVASKKTNKTFSYSTKGSGSSDIFVQFYTRDSI